MGDGPVRGSLASANGNKSVGLLAPATWTRTLEMLDAYEAMGVEMIKIDVKYPVLTPAFHTYLRGATRLRWCRITFATAAELHRRRRTASITSWRRRSARAGWGCGSSTGRCSGTTRRRRRAGYFADMRTAGIAATQARYTAERVGGVGADRVAAEAGLLRGPRGADDAGRQLRVLPGAGADVRPAGWTAYVHAAAAAIAAASPAATTLLGAGIGTWDSTTYLTLFAPMADLDFFDIHIYPLQSLTAGLPAEARSTGRTTCAASRRGSC